MKRSKQQTAQTRLDIIEAASALFRERGLDGVSVAELMEKVGLTHGGFYKHFDSKEALMAEAAAAAFDESMREWRKAIEAKKDQDPVCALIDLYLSESHRKNLEHGCPVVSLGSEMTRSDGTVRNRFAKGVRGMIEAFVEQLGDKPLEQRRELAITIVASLVGTMVIARCSDNDKTAQAYLDAARNQLTRLWERFRG
jgi:TetR/AcrR family transcriptional regulator, transcriptional repressor for nem operon